MKGNEIVASAEPSGRFLEGIIDGTPKPGTVMQLKAATEPVGGRHTWEVFTPGSDGDRGLIAVLREDHLQGKGPNDAYVSGSRGFLYAPGNGDELNMRVKDLVGTADTYAIGDKMMVENGSGLLIDATSEESAPFQVMETMPALTEDTLVHCVFTGY